MEIYYVSISSTTNGPPWSPPSFLGPFPSSATEDRLAIPIVHTTGVDSRRSQLQIFCQRPALILIRQVSLTPSKPSLGFKINFDILYYRIKHYGGADEITRNYKCINYL